MDRTSFSPELQELLRRAEAMAHHQRSEFILPEHVFFVVANLEDGMVPAILDHLKISANKIKALLEEELKFVLPTSVPRETLAGRLLRSTECLHPPALVSCQVIN